tara:strand:- start:2937 stop:4220 length:1284 start_codon:yes stop_codon:yes gene_type:complete
MKVFDPVHRFIHLNEQEVTLIDTLPLQRLRYLHQVGVTFLVFPGARHSRFEHSIGVMQVATQLFDALTNESNLSPACLEILPNLQETKSIAYWRQVLRCAALCHDLGHTPFSHSLEFMLGEDGHEKVTQMMIHSPFMLDTWQQFDSLPGRDIAKDIAQLALGPTTWNRLHPHDKMPLWERLLSLIITSDCFGADRIDYLQRDAFFTGVAHGVIDYDQLKETITFIITPDNRVDIGFQKSGVTSIESLLLARYFMHSRVYQNKRAQVYDFHLKKFVKSDPTFKNYCENLEDFLFWQDHTVLSAIDMALRNPQHSAHKLAKRLKIREERYQLLEIDVHNAKQLEEIQTKAVILKKQYGERVCFDYSKVKLTDEYTDAHFVLCVLENGDCSPICEYSELLAHTPVPKSRVSVFLESKLVDNIKKTFSIKE